MSPLSNATTLANYASGIGTQGATLEIDSNNKRVGIGTTNPQGPEGSLQVGTAVTISGNSGIVSATTFHGDFGSSTSVAGNLNVSGVITYEDVTNIDSVGIITARNAVVISENNAIHFRGTATDDNDAILRATAGGGQLLINSRNDTIINIDANSDSTNAYFAVAKDAATGSSTELFRVQENGNFGLGTNSPSQKLHVAGDGSTYLQVERTTSGSEGTIFVGTEAGHNQIISRTVGGSTNPKDLRFLMGSSEAMRIDSSGRLLMNTTSSRSVMDQAGNGPTPNLQIEATNSDAIMSIISAGTADANRCGTINLGRHRNSTVGATPTIVQDNDALGAIVFSGGDGGDMLTCGAKIHAVVDGTPGANDMPGALIFSTTPDGQGHGFNTERMRVDSSGRLMVGTSNNVADTASLLQVSSAGGPKLALNLQDGTVANGQFASSIDFYSFGGYVNESIASIQAYADGTHASGDKPGRLVFATSADGASSPTERMRITSSGNIGIGKDPTTNYGTNLQIHSTGTNGAALHLTDASTGGSNSDGFHLVNTNSGNVYFWNRENTSQIFATNGSERLRIAASGNVGIGEDNPSSNLVVKQSGSTFTTQTQTVALFQRSSTTGHGAKIAIVAGNLSASDINFGDTDDEDIGKIQYFHTDNSLRFTTNASEQVIITSSGQMGIGQASPQGDLHIGNISGSKNLIMHSANNGNARLRFREGGSNTSGFNEYSFGMVGNANALTWDKQGLGEVMRIDSSGALLINTTTNATAKLVVQGDTGAGDDGINIISGSTSVGSKAAIWFSPSTTGSTTTGSAIKSERLSPDGSDLQFYTCTALGNASNEAMRIDRYGRLLVGATSGLGKFIVQDSSLPKIQANYNGTKHVDLGVGNSGCGFVMSTGLFMTFNHQPYANRGTDNNLTERMRILSSGGLTFNGDTAQVNALDDYEEGTWTPVVYGSSTNGTASYSYQNARYTKIGRKVHIECYVNFSSHTGTGALYLYGLPYTVNNGQIYGGPAINYWHQITVSNGASPHAIFANNHTYIYFYQQLAGQASSLNMVSAGGMILAGSYSI